MLRDSTKSDMGGASPQVKIERDRRRSLGIYYTPPEAAKVLARWAIRHPEEIVLEPSFGGCAMLSAAVNVFKCMGNDRPSKQLYGYDVDAAAFVHLARMGIDNVDGHFKKQDFLRSSADNVRVDAVLANPPFVSSPRLSENQRELTEQLRQRYLPHLPRKASLWAYFLLHSLSFLRAGGRMAFVLPNAVGTADYARPLLTFLQQRFAQVEIVHVSERLFIQEGADERISLLFLSGYIPEGCPRPAPVRSRDIVRISEISEDQYSTGQSTAAPRTLDMRGEATAALAGLGAGVLCELGSVASVQIGEVVGNVRFFVRPLSEWRQLNVDTEHLEPLFTRSAQIRGAYVAKGAIYDDSSRIPFLLLPPEQDMPEAIEEYLAHYPAQDVAANRTFRKRSVWYRCSYKGNADAFIGSMSHDYPRIIGNEAGISCSNAFYKIIVQERPDLAAWLPIVSLTTPLCLSAEIIGRIRGSGGIKLEPSDVKKLYVPTKVPRLAEPEFKALRQAINKMLSQGDLDAASQLADSQVFLLSGLINAQAMSRLRLLRLSLSSYRLTTPCRNS